MGSAISFNPNPEGLGFVRSGFQPELALFFWMHSDLKKW
jgi:hypothetical protein